MRSPWTLLLLPAFLLGPLAHGQEPMRYSRVRVHTTNVPGGLDRLTQLGLAVDHGDVKRGAWIETDLSEREIGVLAAKGVAYDLLIEDVTAFYVERNRAGAPKAARDGASPCWEQPAFTVPDHITTGSMGGYFTWDEMVAILDEMVTEYPGLISPKQSIGESWEGRPLYMVRISNAPNVDQDKPEVLYDALHHAREPASLSQLLFYMWYLLENYGTDAEVSYLVDNTELYFVPCVNPDGYVYNELMQPEGGGMWRRNRRDNGDGSFGVDLNRNYGHEWGFNDSGSSPDTGSDVYRGPAPFSEPETQAMRDLCNAHTFRLALNYHTYGDLLVYPWSYIPSFYTPDSAVFTNYGQLLTRDNRYRYGTSDQTVNYTVNGGSDDWMYGEQASKPKILSMTPEAGNADDGFWPAEWRIPDICQVNMGQNLRMAHLAGRYAQATDRTGPVLDALSAMVHFNLTRLGQEPGTFTVGITPLDLVLSAGTADVFTGMELLETRSDSIAITLDPSVASGDVVRFVLTVGNGLYTHRDTIDKVFGAPTMALDDPLDSDGNWGPGDWGLSTQQWYSPPTSMSDSPVGFYNDNENNELTLDDPIDLSDATSATLVFMAQWDIESRFDHAQVLASSNGSTWTPLCGRWTRPGSPYQDEGEPVYDSRQSTWVEEQMSLDAYLGGPVHLRFLLVSDFGQSEDGFYFDDLRVVTTTDGPTAVGGPGAVQATLSCTPNPATDRAIVSYSLPGTGTARTLAVYDALGTLVEELPLSGPRGSVVLNTAERAPGVYVCVLRTEGLQSAVQRLVVARP